MHGIAWHNEGDIVDAAHDLRCGVYYVCNGMYHRMPHHQTRRVIRVRYLVACPAVRAGPLCFRVGACCQIDGPIVPELAVVGDAVRRPVDARAVLDTDANM